MIGVISDVLIREDSCGRERDFRFQQIVDTLMWDDMAMDHEIHGETDQSKTYENVRHCVARLS